MTIEMYEAARKNGKVVYHRNPTASEIKFGHGAIHYAEFDRDDDNIIHPKTKKLKAWFKSPHDGLRYYR
jgi:hypothetical protein